MGFYFRVEETKWRKQDAPYAVSPTKWIEYTVLLDETKEGRFDTLDQKYAYVYLYVYIFVHLWCSVVNNSMNHIPNCRQAEPITTHQNDGTSNTCNIILFLFFFFSFFVSLFGFRFP